MSQQDEVRIRTPISKLSEFRVDFLRNIFGALMRANIYDCRLDNLEFTSFFTLNIAGVVVQVNVWEPHMEYAERAMFIMMNVLDFTLIIDRDVVEDHDIFSYTLNHQISEPWTHVTLQPLFDHLDDLTRQLNIRLCNHALHEQNEE